MSLKFFNKFKKTNIFPKKGKNNRKKGMYSTFLLGIIWTNYFLFSMIVAVIGQSHTIKYHLINLNISVEVKCLADIVDTAMAAGNFKTLIKAVQAADLVGTLKSAGPFTVFAPTDEAFSKLPQGTVEGLLKDIPKLKSILTYHVVSGKVMAADVAKLKNATTVEGEEIHIDASRWHLHRNIKVNNAEILKADIMADNGVIHVINKVLMPPMEMKH